MRSATRTRVLCLVWAALTCAHALAQDPAQQRIEIFPGNHAYWAYGDQPALLLGGSVQDNLFQIPGIEAHLDLLHSVGGNYVRCTMSSRDDGDVWAFARREDGRYDLDAWNEEYWRRFETFLRLTNERDIIVQIEVWATFDFYLEYWPRNPFNPNNNVNYSAEESGLPTAKLGHPLSLTNNWFWSVPAERNQPLVLKYQHRFVDRLLSHSLKYGNVLYCMDNETAVTPEWGKYWSEYIKAKANETGVSVHTTEMWDPWNLSDPKHSNTFDHPETYSFVDISQNNHKKGQAHWDNAQKQRQRIASAVRPINCVKIYGADTGKFGDTRHGVERFWRNVFGGLASSRFHRPTSGLGLGDLAQANLRSMRLITGAVDAFGCNPHNDLLSEREPNEAYCMAQPGKEYAVYFPNGGAVKLDASAMKKAITVRWLNVVKSEWSPSESLTPTDTIALSCPADGHWAVVVQAS